MGVDGYRRKNDAWQVLTERSVEQYWGTLHATEWCRHGVLRVGTPAMVRWSPLCCPVPRYPRPWLNMLKTSSSVLPSRPLQWQRAIRLLELMWQIGGELCPDIVSYNTVIKACGNAGQVGGGRRREGPTDARYLAESRTQLAHFHNCELHPSCLPGHQAPTLCPHTASLHSAVAVADSPHAQP